MAAQHEREEWGKLGTGQDLHEDCTADPQTQGLMDTPHPEHSLFSSYKRGVKGRWKGCPCYKNFPEIVNFGVF